MKKKKETIKLEFPKKFYEDYKEEVEANLGRKINKEELVKVILEDLQYYWKF